MISIDLLASLLLLAADAAATDLCQTSALAQFVCGPDHPEDLAAVPGTRWIVSGGMASSGRAGDLYLVDTRNRSAVPLRAAAHVGAADPRYPCATPPDPSRFVAHGISLRRGVQGQHKLFVVNHGGREAIEIFSVDVRRKTPAIKWVGCVPAPRGVIPNAVVSLRSGGFVMTAIFNADTSDELDEVAALAAGTPVGGVFRWMPEKGFTRLALPPISGPNGVEVSKDERQLFVSGWGDGNVWRIPLDSARGEAPQRLKLDFLPDNLHWAPDGTLLATGQTATVAGTFACARDPAKPAYCHREGRIVAINSDQLTAKRQCRISIDGFGDSASAIHFQHQLWIGSYNGRRIAMLPASCLSPDSDGLHRSD